MGGRKKQTPMQAQAQALVCTIEAVPDSAVQRRGKRKEREKKGEGEERRGRGRRKEMQNIEKKRE